MATGSASNPIVVNDANENDQQQHQANNDNNAANNNQLGSADNPILVREGEWDYLDNLEAHEIREELLKKRVQWFLDNY